MKNFLIKILLVSLIFSSASTIAQNKIELKAFFDVENKQIRINQEIIYKNTSKDTLNTIYLIDWNNAYSTKTTPLAKRFTEDFSNRFHFAKSEERGFTVITSLKNQNEAELQYENLKNHQDVIEVTLNNKLLPNESYSIRINYIVQVPDDSFTSYGITKNGDFKLKYWYLTPAVYDGKWNYYSNKDLDDLFIPNATLDFEIEFPRNYVLNSELDVVDIAGKGHTQVVKLYGENRVDTKLILDKFPKFKNTETDFFTVVTDIEDEGLLPIEKTVIIDDVARFITDNLGAYPHKKLLITNEEYRKAPIYGLNQLPDFIRPFPDNFQYEFKILKTALNNYLINTLQINPRTDQWLIDGFQIYFMMKYAEQKYPNTKLLGSLANFWGLRSFHLSKLDFNDQYNFMYMNMARSNLDQPLKMPKDSLTKFNENIANKYKAGIGLNYLDSYINKNIIEETIIEFIALNKQQPTTTKDFELLLESKTTKDLDWFFNEYLTTRKKTDYKITHVKETKDSLLVTIKNKQKSILPIMLYAFNKDSVVYKTWVSNIKKSKTISIPKENVTNLILNYDKVVPEINQRNNSKSLTSFINKPLKFMPFKDAENPYKSQIFFMPSVKFDNIYDGLSIGARINNKAILKKPFVFKMSPLYSTKSKSFTGSSSVQYNQDLEGVSSLYKIYYGLGVSYSSYAPELFVTVYQPSFSLNFRDSKNLRSNQRSVFNIRYLDINRDPDINNISDVNEPNYGVLNIRYINNNPGLANYSKWYTDLQFSQTFSKLSFNYEYRKLFQNNRKLNVRFFLGTFFSNKNDVNNDYFSFALDRPTDYLFEYNYLGRSEDTGIFSQQLIIADGGFKSKLSPAFANQWITTINASTTLWKYIQVYGDVGLVKNKLQKPKFVYDSGFRINLVEDYFEIYFPLHSNLGWEIGQPNYSQKIRFKFTAEPKSLLGLFQRRWY